MEVELLRRTSIVSSSFLIEADALRANGCQHIHSVLFSNMPVFLSTSRFTGVQCRSFDLTGLGRANEFVALACW
jgi:hypothetical protein